jgi:4-hydroxybenzoate polyprenyltransferase
VHLLEKIINYLKEFRYTQWVKNIVVYLPMFFGGKSTNFETIQYSSLAFILFSLTASLVYVINDIRDVEEDRLHPEKKNRPLASGKIKSSEMKVVLILMLLGFGVTLFFIDQTAFKIVLIIYFVINILYSLGLKRIPILEMLIVSLCYSLRLLGGGLITGIEISPWLNLLIFSGAMLIIGGKRLTEKRNSNIRYVLKYYPVRFLRSWVILTSVFSIIFMFLYTLAQGLIYIPQSIIFALAIIRFLYLLETTKKGESTEILYDKIILLLLVIFSIYSFYIIYF